jgi:hypothetical protein
VDTAGDPAAPVIGIPGGGVNFGGLLHKISAGDYDVGWDWLPAPLAAGAPRAFHTDPLGDLWVAKGDIAAGAWKRARDVLFGRTYFNATNNCATTNSPFGFNAVDRDSYDLFTASGPGCATLPVGGMWQINSMITVTSTAAAWTNHTHTWNLGATPDKRKQVHMNVAGTLTNDLSGTRIIPANTPVQIYFYGSTAMALVANGQQCYFEVAYLGTGGT